MSSATDGNVEVIRQEVRIRHRRRRTLDERLAVWFPRLSRRLAVLSQRLSPGSRLRRTLVARTMGSQYEAFNRRDFELLLSRAHPEFEWDFTRATPIPELELGATLLRGKDGLLGFLEDWVDAWEDYRIEPEEAVYTTGDRILVLSRESGRGRGSGVEVERPLAEVFTIRDGLGLRVQTFSDPAEAFAELGIADTRARPTRESPPPVVAASERGLGEAQGGDRRQ